MKTNLSRFIFNLLTAFFFGLAGLNVVLAQENSQQDHSSGYHLAYKNNTLHIHAQFTNPPVVGKEGFLQLQAMNPALHQPTDLTDKVEVVLWMPDMGHGSSPTRVEKALDQNGQAIPGAYNVRKIYFVMGGAWEVRVVLTDAQGQKETQTFSVDL